MKVIFKSFKTSGFVSIANELARDSRLSFRARGLLVMILSHSENWEVSTGWLEKQGTEGREAIKSALEELKLIGYAKYFPGGKDENERFKPSMWEFYDTPKTAESTTFSSGFPSTASRTRLPVNGKSHPQNTIAEYNNQNLASGEEGEQGKADTAVSEPKKPRERNLALDALATIDGSDVAQITPTHWSRAAKALSGIKNVCPEVTPNEIFRRAENYRRHFEGAAITSTALEANWAKCDKPPVVAKRNRGPNI